MRRREFITLFGSLATLPTAPLAQTMGRKRLIGVLMGLAETDSEASPRMRIVRDELTKLGWKQGINIDLHYRWAASSPQLMQTHARELVEAGCDAIIGHTTPVVAALRKQTDTVPIVFVQVSDPVGSGLVESLARPGGNVTGFSNFEFGIGSKWLQELKELMPAVSRAVLIFNPKTAPYAPHFIDTVVRAGPAFDVRVSAKPLDSPEQIDAVLDAERGDGLAIIVLPDIFTTTHRKLIISAAERNRLPTLYPFRYFVVEGGLFCYGIDNLDLFRRAVPYVDAILKHAYPHSSAVIVCDLPTEMEVADGARQG
jgi:putative ABC transport system substrate-binding protein